MEKTFEDRRAPKHDALEYRNADGVINIGPCHVSEVTISAEGVNADIDVYDGVGSNGELKLHLEALSGTTFNWTSTHGVPFRKGIYLVVNASTTHAMISFHVAEFGQLR